MAAPDPESREPSSTPTGPPEPADSQIMKIGGSEALGQDYSVRVEKLAQNAAKQEGEAAVSLIEGSTPPPAGPNGEGTHINTYA